MTTVLQVSLYGLVALASGMLAYAEGSGFPNALSIPLTLMALFVAEMWKMFLLPTRWANVLGLIAVGFGIWEFSGENIEARLLSLTHVLVYLTWIVLFLEKSPRLYWTMCALAALHVAVGAVLTSSGLYGLMLALFLVTAVWTLTVFTLYRAREKYSEQSHESANSISTGNGHSDAQKLIEQNKPAAADGFVWNLRSHPVNGLQLDPNLKWISWPFVSGVLTTVILSAGIGGMFFLLTPRIWVGNFTAFGDTPDTALRELRTGFAEEVQLGDIGQILESTHPVFEVRFTDETTGQPIPAEEFAVQLGLDEPLFRGAVMGEYAGGRWRVGTTGRQEDNWIAVNSTPQDVSTIRQEFRLEPTDSKVLFTMPPHIACRVESRNAPVVERRLTSVLQLKDSLSGRDRLVYSVFSQKPLRVKADHFPRGVQGNPTHRRERDYYCQLPPNGLNRLQELAKRLVRPDAATENTASLTELSPLDAARRLEAYLKTSGEFGYTLDMSITDSTIDPVEDFLFNRKVGHCEYFASTLALMLRAVNIPARLVSGFKGGDLNPSTGYFVTQQRHSHVWVEANINRQWLILDPTPAGRDDSVKSLAPKDTLLSSITQFFNDTWSHRIVGLSFDEQSSSLYLPLKAWTTNIYDALKGQVESLVRGDAERNTSQSTRASLRIGIAMLSGCGLVWLFAKLWRSTPNRTFGWMPAGLFRTLNWLFPREPSDGRGHDWRTRLRNWWTQWICRLSGQPISQHVRVEFYERFLRLFRAAGLEPLPTQTAREFVCDSQSQWHAQLSASDLVQIPPEVITQFYRVRFGGELLTAEELGRLDQQLDQLESQWQRRS